MSGPLSPPGAGSAGCVFCRLASGQTPAAVVLDEGDTLVFLDHRPLFPGHCLVIPKDHVETLHDLAPERVGPLFAKVQRLARAVERALGAEGTMVGLNNKVSQSVPHLHVHVVPRRKGDGLRGFFWPRQKYASDEAMRDCAARIAAAWAEPG